MQINFQAVDVNKYRYIQIPTGLLIFEVIGHVYAVQCEVLLLKILVLENTVKWEIFVSSNFRGKSPTAKLKFAKHFPSLTNCLFTFIQNNNCVFIKHRFS